MLFSPDRPKGFGPTDLTVGSKQSQSLNEGGSSDNAIRGIFGISRWKSNGAHARAAANRQDHKPGLNFLKEGFKADIELDAALTRECR